MNKDKKDYIEDISTTIFMKIDSQQSLFSYKKNEIKTPIGFDLIKEKFFKDTFVNSDEIEYAINYIEDEIEKIVPLLPKDYSLCSCDDFLMDIALLCGEEKSQKIELSRDKIEYLFGLYAEVAQGRAPLPFLKDISPLFYAKLLILREFMHHIKFDVLTIYKNLY